MTKEQLKKIIPNTWTWTTLGEVGIILSGGTPSTKEPRYWGKGIAWITPADLSNYKSKYISNGARFITQVGLENSSAVLLPQGTLLYSSRAPIGYVAISQNELSTSQGFKNIIPVKSICVDYLYYYLIYAKELAISMASGTTFLELSAKKFANIALPLPPLNEQHRIVEKIEELFSKIEKTREQLSNSLKLLSTYKKSILDDAYRGLLTNEEFDKKGFPIGWKIKKIVDICDVVRGGSPRPAGDPRYYGGDIPFLKVGDLTKDDSVYLYKYSTTIKEAGLKKTRQIKPNTLLLTNSGATLGVPKICMIDATMNDGIAAFVDLDPKSNLYLYYFWKSKTEELRLLNQGVAQPNLNTIIIKNQEIPYCSFEKQKEVVSEIESRFSVCDKLEEYITQSLRKIDTLEKDILSKAFSGNLVEQDINDEPAILLLDKIKSEKEKATKAFEIKKKQSKNALIQIDMSKELKNIVEVLSENSTPMSAKEVWISSKHKDDIDEFYENLKELIDNGTVVESSRQGKDVFLKLVDR